MKKIFTGLLALNLSLSGVGIWPRQPVLAQSQAIPSQRQVFEQLAQLAEQQIQQGQPAQAIAILQNALLIARQFNFKKAEASILNNIGLAYFNIGQSRKALEYYEQSLLVTKELKDQNLEVTTQFNIGEAYRRMSQPQKALGYYNQTLQSSRRMRDRNVEAKSLFGIGEVYITNQPKKALGYYLQALPILKEIKDQIGEATTLFSIGVIYRSILQPQKALEYYLQALPIMRKTKNRQLETAILENLTELYGIFLSQPQKALEYSNQLLTITRENRDRKQEAKILGIFGSLYTIINQLQKALEYYNKSLLITKEVKDRNQEAQILNSTGEVYVQMGQPEKALESFTQSLFIFREIKNPKQEAQMLTRIASFYTNIGQPRKVLEFYNQALPILRKIKDRVSEGNVLMGIGSTYSVMGQSQKALEFYNRALILAKENNTPLGEDSAFPHKLNELLPLFQIAFIYSQIGQQRKALEIYNQILPIARKSELPVFEAFILLLMGDAYQSIGQQQKALDFYDQVLSIAREAKYRSLESQVHTKLAALKQSRGDLKEALPHIESAIKIIETMRTEIISQEFRTSFFASNQDYYDIYINMLMQLHKQQPSQGFNARALQASERARARSLIELLNESRTDIRQGVDPKLLEQEKNLQFQLNSLEKRRIELYSKTPTKEQTTRFEKEYDTLLSQSENLKAQIRSRSPRYAALTQPKSLTLVEIQQQVLDNNTVLLEYFLGKDRSYLWAVTPSGISSYELPKQAEIEAASEKFRKVVRDPNAQHADIIQAGKPLTQMLLGPVAKQLGQKRLLIVGNGALQYLPFSALPNLKDSQPLLVNHEIINLPSASTLATLRQELNGRKLAPKTVAMFADPVFSPNDDRVGNKKPQSDDSSAQKNSISEPFSMQTLRGVAEEAGLNFERLRGTRQEAKNILQLLPENMQTQALDFEANKNNVLNPKLSQSRIIHFATHGILNTTRPELSAVVLSLVDRQGRAENGFLRLNDIFNLNLPAELVVLSACQTGLGQNVRGEGLIGLTRGFMYAGSPRVLVSLWSVNDDSTAVLMTEFYKAMLQQKLTPAAALRAAQLKMLQSQWKSPYHWAAFTLQGEWR
jgi:CHAT domain-containing protein/predicted negative regulator of RcsB-dependent stress response